MGFDPNTWLLSIATPGFWSGIGFILSLGGLIGEFVVLVISFRRYRLEKGLAAVFTVIMALGLWVGRVGDDALFAAVQLRAETAEARITKIMTPRTLSENQHGVLVKCLRAGPKGIVHVRPGMLDTDGPILGERIEKALGEAGFEQAPDWKAGAVMTWHTPGLFLVVKDLKKPMFFAASVQRCFKEIGWEAVGYEDPNHPEDALSIAIGSRL